MLQNKPIKLKVSGKQDFALPVCALYLLAVVAGLLSPHPILLTIFVIVLFGVMWGPAILGFTKANKAELISVIFPDGRVRLEFDRKDKIEGFLEGQQWCTRWLAVIQLADGNTTRKLIISAARQEKTDDFRRLHMWLRQGLYNNTGVKPVLDS
jgi:hypothetical protein